MTPLPPLPAFPPGFLWGASASAFQTEGAADAEGKGPSGWDAFAAQGRIKDGADASRGTGFHARYREDVALLAGLGADAFRFSVSWPRVVPGGSGPANAAGLDFYDRLVDELCAHGIMRAVCVLGERYGGEVGRASPGRRTGSVLSRWGSGRAGPRRAPWCAGCNGSSRRSQGEGDVVVDTEVGEYGGGAAFPPQAPRLLLLVGEQVRPDEGDLFADEGAQVFPDMWGSRARLRGVRYGGGRLRGGEACCGVAAGARGVVAEQDS